MIEYNNTVINLKYTGPIEEFSISMYLEEQSDIIRTTGVRAIEEAHGLELDSADVATIDIDGTGFVDFSVPREQWPNFLEKSKEHLLELEEYELMIVVERLLKEL